MLPTAAEMQTFCSHNRISVTQIGTPDVFREFSARLEDPSAATGDRPDFAVDLPISEHVRPRRWSEPQCVHALALYLLSLLPGQEISQSGYQQFSSQRDDLPWYRSFPQHGGFEALLPKARGLETCMRRGFDPAPTLRERKRQRQAEGRDALWAEILDANGHPPWEPAPPFDDQRALTQPGVAPKRRLVRIRGDARDRRRRAGGRGRRSRSLRRPGPRQAVAARARRPWPARTQRPRLPSTSRWTQHVPLAAEGPQAPERDPRPCKRSSGARTEVDPRARRDRARDHPPGRARPLLPEGLGQDARSAGRTSPRDSSDSRRSVQSRSSSADRRSAAARVSGVSRWTASSASAASTPHPYRTRRDHHSTAPVLLRVGCTHGN